MWAKPTHNSAFCTLHFAFRKRGVNEMKLSLVVPCYNEEGNVRLFHDTAAAVFDHEGYEYEIVFVNDGSKDSTLEKLKELHAESDKNIRIISFPEISARKPQCTQAFSTPRVSTSA